MSTVLTDAEIIALAAIANVDAARVLAANMDRKERGEAMAYDGCDSDAAARLEEEMRRRGVLGSSAAQKEEVHVVEGEPTFACFDARVTAWVRTSGESMRRHEGSSALAANVYRGTGAWHWNVWRIKDDYAFAFDSTDDRTKAEEAADAALRAEGYEVMT